MTAEEDDELTSEVQKVWDEYLWGRFQRIQALTDAMDEDPLASVEAATLAKEVGEVILNLDVDILMNLTIYIGALYASLRSQTD